VREEERAQIDATECAFQDAVTLDAPARHGINEETIIAGCCPERPLVLRVALGDRCAQAV